MPTELRRFTISITPDMERALDEAKKNRYYRDTQSEMIRDLIIRGLAALKAEAAADSDYDRSA